MFVSAKETAKGLTLTWSLQFVEPSQEGQVRMLDVRYHVEATEDLYLGDRVWTYDQAGHRRVDLQGVYRFMVRRDLRLVFAQSPLPPDTEYRHVYAPYFSRLGAGEKMEKHVRFPVPVDEYSAFARDIDAPTTIEYASTVTFVMGYRLRATMTTDPIAPPFESPDEAGYIVHDSQLLISSAAVEHLPVKCRNQAIPRFMLPTDRP